MPFKNREEAAQRLAEKLSAYRGRNPLVLAIPRGAVPMARILAGALDGEMDVVLVHKLGAPGNPELAIGSVDENGRVYLRPDIGPIGIGERYLLLEKRKQMKVLKDRRALYTPFRPPIDPSGRVVIIVDDGIATGATMVAALRAVRARKPARLIAAAAVASSEAVETVRGLADETVCLTVPDRFYAVGQFFDEFRPVSDEEAVEILKKIHAEREGRIASV
jgi:predicted phosphoribosyltransferase